MLPLGGGVLGGGFPAGGFGEVGFVEPGLFEPGLLAPGLEPGFALPGLEPGLEVPGFVEPGLVGVPFGFVSGFGLPGFAFGLLGLAFGLFGSVAEGCGPFELGFVGFAPGVFGGGGGVAVGGAVVLLVGGAVLPVGACAGGVWLVLPPAGGVPPDGVRCATTQVAHRKSTVRNMSFLVFINEVSSMKFCCQSFLLLPNYCSPNTRSMQLQVECAR